MTAPMPPEKGLLAPPEVFHDHGYAQACAAFHRLTLAQRNAAWREVEELRRVNDMAEATIEALRNEVQRLGRLLAVET